MNMPSAALVETLKDSDFEPVKKVPGGRWEFVRKKWPIILKHLNA